MSSRFCEIPTVTVHVGPTKTPFYIHKAKICDVSTFFRSAFEAGMYDFGSLFLYISRSIQDIWHCLQCDLHVNCGPDIVGNGIKRIRLGFKEASEQTISCLEDDIDAFDSFSDWLYTGNCDILRQPNVKDNTVFEKLLDLFCFADKYAIGEFRMQIMDKAFEQCRTAEAGHLFTNIDSVWDSTGANSGMRRLIVDFLT